MNVICVTVDRQPYAIRSVQEVIMETANEFIARFMTSLESRQRSTTTPGRCQAPISDVLPSQTRAMVTIRDELCPDSRCSDVDRAIIGASLGG